MAIFNDDISINTLLGTGSFIKGDLKVNGFMRIDGDLDGNLETSGNLIIGANARINGNVTALSATISGIVKGNVNAVNSVKLLSNSTVIGDIQTHSLEVEENVLIHGHYISLREDKDYQEAITKWQNTQAIVQRSIIKSVFDTSETNQNKE